VHALFGLPYELVGRECASNSQNVLFLLYSEHYNLLFLIELLFTGECREARPLDPLFEESFELLMTDFLTDVKEIVSGDCAVVILALSGIEQHAVQASVDAIFAALLDKAVVKDREHEQRFNLHKFLFSRMKLQEWTKLD
jgi:hypothetical protein